MHPFRQDSNFAYLTGVLQPGFACAIDSETGHYTLLAPKLDPSLVVWMGAQPSLDDLAEQYGADSCIYLGDASHVVSASDMDIVTMQEQFSSRELLDAFASAPRKVVRVWHDHQQKGRLVDVLSACRAIKTDADVACLQHASAVSAQAHLAMWR